MSRDTLCHVDGNPKRILLACNWLEHCGFAPFTVVALVVASWEQFPEHFGINHYSLTHRSYPDSVKVRRELYGINRLLARGLLRSLPDLTLTLTDKGRKMVEQIQLSEEQRRNVIQSKKRERLRA